MWVPFGSYLLNSTANPAQFEIHSFYYFIKNPQTTISLTFLTYIISAIDGVRRNPVDQETLQLFLVNHLLVCFLYAFASHRLLMFDASAFGLRSVHVLLSKFYPNSFRTLSRFFKVFSSRFFSKT